MFSVCIPASSLASTAPVSSGRRHFPFPMNDYISLAKLRYDLHYCRRRGSPGPYNITKPSLKRLGQEMHLMLLDYFNEVWRSGKEPYRNGISGLCYSYSQKWQAPLHSVLLPPNIFYFLFRLWVGFE